MHNETNDDDDDDEQLPTIDGTSTINVSPKLIDNINTSTIATIKLNRLWYNNDLILITTTVLL